MAVSEDNGTTWSELTPISNQAGGIVVMSDLIPLKTGKGHYMASYHANARGKDGHGEFHTIEQYVTFTEDGGLTWTSPRSFSQGQGTCTCVREVLSAARTEKQSRCCYGKTAGTITPRSCFPKMKVKHGLPQRTAGSPVRRPPPDSSPA